MSNVVIIGGDRRNYHLAQKLHQSGCDVCSLYIENSPCDSSHENIKNVLSDSKIIVLPLPCSVDGTNFNTPMYKEKVCMEDILSLIPAGSMVFGGKILSEVFEKYEFEVYDYASRGDFAALNAVPTAEGAIEAIMKVYAKTIFKSRVLITGFGKISKVLSLLLKSMGAHVTVAARKETDIAMAKALGYDSVRICDMHSELKNSDIIVNTVPHMIFNEKELDCIAPSVPFADLASLPGGTDPESALKRGINYMFLPGIPGKYSPHTAADIILETIENIIAESGKDAKSWIYGIKK